MSIEIEPLKDEKKPGTHRWRRLSAAAGVAVLACGGTVLVASPASADSVCGSYHSWEECIDFSGGVLSATAHNGYSVSEVETIVLNGVDSPQVNIPSGKSVTFGYFVGDGPLHACAGIDSVTIVCGNL